MFSHHAIPPIDPQARGRWAEQRACRYLQWRGWRVCARNWIGGGAELDIVCSRWQTLLIAEVRFRGNDLPFASIDHVKLQHIRRSALALIHQQHLRQYHIRFDALGVKTDGSIEQRRDICYI